MWPENAEIVRAFLLSTTQWRTIVVGADKPRLVRTGLDYAGARAGIEAAGLTLTPELWAGLRIMEIEAMEASNQ